MEISYTYPYLELAKHHIFCLLFFFYKIREWRGCRTGLAGDGRGMWVGG
jgi:hypothetical protein